jgi:hypothetical protein
MRGVSSLQSARNCMPTSPSPSSKTTKHFPLIPKNYHTFPQNHTCHPLIMHPPPLSLGARIWEPQPLPNPILTLTLTLTPS